MNKLAILPPLYFAPVSWYALCSRYERVIIDTSMRADRRYKAVHRTAIAATGVTADTQAGQAPLMLTAAICRHNSPAPLNTILLSDHDRWWEKHARSIATAYGRTPYFEYLWPRFAELLNDSLPGTALVELNLAIDSIVREMLAIDTPVSIPLDDAYDDKPEQPYISPRHISLPDACDFRSEDFYCGDGTLSILDPLFRLGPDATHKLLHSYTI